MPQRYPTRYALELRAYLIERVELGERPDDQELRRWAARLTRHVARELSEEGVELGDSVERAVRNTLHARLRHHVDGLLSEALIPGAPRSDSLLTAVTRIARATRVWVGQARRVATQSFLQAAGIRRYRWITRRDARVRRTHQQNHNRIFTWAEGDPDEGHPGDAPGCRCSARPVLTGGV